MLRSCATGLNLDLCLLLPCPNHHIIVTRVRAPNSAFSPLGRLQPFPQITHFVFGLQLKSAVEFVDDWTISHIVLPAAAAAAAVAAASPGRAIVGDCTTAAAAVADGAAR